MKRFLACMVSLVMCFSFALPPTAAHAAPQLSPQSTPFSGSADLEVAESGSDWTMAMPHEREELSLDSDFTARSMGFGGHGAVFDPVISPFDHNTMVADCDMGAVYVTHDGGGNWDIKNCGGVVWDIQADPSTAGRFYAAGSGLWRSNDNGDTWDLIWPKPETVEYTPTKLNHDRTYYFSTDSYPDAHTLEALVVDPTDSNHLVAMTAAAANAVDNPSSTTPWRYLFESFDAGDSFTCVAQYRRTKSIALKNFENTHVYVEHGASSQTSRVVIDNPDGIYELDRAATDISSALTPLYEAPQTIGDMKQVVDGSTTYYVVLENVDEATARATKSRVKLWRTSDFSDPSATVDFTSELVASLPTHFNTQRDRQGSEGEILLHNVGAIEVPSLDRMYLCYRTYDVTRTMSWQGVNGLITYDANRPANSRFQWTFGLRLWWSGEDIDARVTPDQNRIMARAHSDSSYTFFSVAVDPRDSRRIALPTHTGLLYSPNIDADVGKGDGGLDNVNIYPRYATYVSANPDNPKSVVDSIMRSNGLEVTVTQHVSVDPFDADHLLMGMDDAGMAVSSDGGETWQRCYYNAPSGISDTCFDAVFDEGEQGVVYSLWHEAGSSIYQPSQTFLTRKGVFARSTDGGKTWDTSYASGLPEKVAAVRVAVDYPRDSMGAITSGERTIYVATMGYGFYVSHDSGRTFEPMNAGIPTLNTPVSGTTDTVDVVWARDILLTDDGRIFGITQYSSMGPKDSTGRNTYHATQDEASFGNVWEWDAAADGGAGKWVKLPLNTVGSAYENGLQVRQPRAMCYDASDRTLYVAAVSCVGNYVTRQRWENFGGGLYSYRSAEGAQVGSGMASAVDWADQLVGSGRNLTGVGFDSGHRMWIATEDGDVFCRRNGSDWVQVCTGFLRLCQGFDMGPDGIVYLTTHGDGALRIAPTFTDEVGDDDPGNGGVSGGQPGSGGGSADGGSGGQQGSAGGVSGVSMHRLYNPYSGEHFYTSSASERDQLAGLGWSYEGEGWRAPAEGEDVYRLYNAYAGDHHYTTSAAERDALVRMGWSYEGVGWKSGGSVPLYRQYNPYASVGSHNYTSSKAENDQLVRLGWRAEGVGWYGV